MVHNLGKSFLAQESKILSGSEKLTSKNLSESIWNHRKFFSGLPENHPNREAIGDALKELESLETAARADGVLSNDERAELKTSWKKLSEQRSTAVEDKKADLLGDTFSQTQRAEHENSDAFKSYKSSGQYTEAPADGPIGEGMKGQRITDLQEKLKKEGFEIEADGFWGPKTQEAYEAHRAAQTTDTKTDKKDNVDKVEDASGVKTAGPISFENGVLKIDGTDAPEDIDIHRVGDNYEIKYTRFDEEDRDQALESHSMQLSADEIKSASFLLGGGGDRIRNGFKNKDGEAMAGINGAKITGRGSNVVTNYADAAKIDMSRANGVVINNHGDDVSIKDSKGRDAIWTDGKNTSVEVGHLDSVKNFGDGMRLRSRGGANVMSIANDVVADGKNGAADYGVWLGTRNLVRFDPALDQGQMLGKRDTERSTGMDFETVRQLGKLSSPSWER